MLCRVLEKFVLAIKLLFIYYMSKLSNFVYIKVETTKEKIVSLELSTPDTEIPEIPTEDAVDEEEETLEKKPSNPSGNKKRRRKRIKPTDKQIL